MSDGKVEIALNRLYKSNKGIGINKVDLQLNPNIFINSGTVNIYGSNSKIQPTSVSDMTLNAENTAINGVVLFDVIPTWIAITQNSGTTTEIVLTGVNAQDKGSIL